MRTILNAVATGSPFITEEMNKDLLDSKISIQKKRALLQDAVNVKSSKIFPLCKMGKVFRKRDINNPHFKNKILQSDRNFQNKKVASFQCLAGI